METSLGKEIRELNIEIAAYPMGHIVKEVVCGKEYYFRRIGSDDHVEDEIYVDPRHLTKCARKSQKGTSLRKSTMSW
ncbi:MAG: hypothetical protein LUD47_01390 [Clostridia bacterium]|nr:hypothetical protein [Clostridia bacterium]